MWGENGGPVRKAVLSFLNYISFSFNMIMAAILSCYSIRFWIPTAPVIASGIYNMNQVLNLLLEESG